uniref:AB hydrolase-1 domain-containing protein n=1 Tax=Polytomella parva TaxID=51329 RepID=A0A7S0UXC1_9CHLO
MSSDALPPPLKRAKLDDSENEVRNFNPIKPALLASSAPYMTDKIVYVDHRFLVPIDYSGKYPGSITLFVREMISSCELSPITASCPLSDQTAPASNLSTTAPSRSPAISSPPSIPPYAPSTTIPYLLYLQGGPGFECPRVAERKSWINVALRHFRVLMLDQRGTGFSSPITTRNLLKKGDPNAQAEFLSHFRADNIVRDCEAVRKILVPSANYGGRWSVLGTSFGGFCAVSYLSFFPNGLNEVMLVGGLPPLIHMGNVSGNSRGHSSGNCEGNHIETFSESPLGNSLGNSKQENKFPSPCRTARDMVDPVYQSLIRRILNLNREFYTMFPDDEELVRRIVRFLDAQPEGGVRLHSGSLLTSKGFQMFGLLALACCDGLSYLHSLLPIFFDGEGDFNPSFGKMWEKRIQFDTNPLYLLLHEPLYCQGCAANWSADRIVRQHCTTRDDPFGEAQPLVLHGHPSVAKSIESMSGYEPSRSVKQITDTITVPVGSHIRILDPAVKGEADGKGGCTRNGDVSNVIGNGAVSSPSNGRIRSMSDESVGPDISHGEAEKTMKMDASCDKYPNKGDSANLSSEKRHLLAPSISAAADGKKRRQEREAEEEELHPTIQPPSSSASASFVTAPPLSAPSLSTPPTFTPHLSLPSPVSCEMINTFDASAAAKDNRPVIFTGEMVFPWMLDDLSSLRELKEVAEVLARRTDWPSLYDVEALRENVVPCAALSYVKDVYVDIDLASETAAKIRGLFHWRSVEFSEHGSLHSYGQRIFERLLSLVRQPWIQY